MQAKLHICLKERGAPHVVPQDEWLRSGCLADATELARIGAIKITRSTTFVLIEPKVLVGTFDSPRLRLEVASKSPTLTEHLIRLLDEWRKRIDVDDSTSEGDSRAIESIWLTFADLLAGLHREGLPWTYEQRTVISSTPRGRILFRDTLTRLALRGISHQVVARSQIRRYFDGLAPALDAIRRRLPTCELTTPPVKSRINRLIGLAGEVIPPVSAAEAKQSFTELSQLGGRPALYRLCNFCMGILEGNNPFRISRRIGSGIAEFVDLERLWECAVRLLAARYYSAADNEVVLHPLRRTKVTLYDDGGPELDPDIMAYDGCQGHCVIDAKYSIVSSPSASDVYQMSSYLSRLRCPIGLLAYVSDGSETRFAKIGTLDDGKELFACYLALDAFEKGQTVLGDILGSRRPANEMLSQ